MAYDEAVADRMRQALEGHIGIEEKKMMGGICFLLNGNMLGGVDRDKQGHGRFMFRVGTQNEAEALARPGAEIVDMGGRRMGGFVFVGEENVDQAALNGWLDLVMDFVTTLPPK